MAEQAKTKGKGGNASIPLGSGKGAKILKQGQTIGKNYGMNPNLKPAPKPPTN